MNVSPECVSEVLDMFYTGINVRYIRSNIKERYGYYPSRSVVHLWVDKYSNKMIKIFNNCYPKVGDYWIVSENILNLRGNNYRIFDIVDEKTYFLLSTCGTSIFNTNDIKIVLQNACIKARKTPKLVLAYFPYSHFEKTEHAIDYEIEHIQRRPSTSNYNTQIFQCIYSIHRDRKMIIDSLRTMGTILKFINHWSVHYNFFRPNELLKMKTPAEAANVDYKIKNWRELVAWKSS